MIGNHDDLNEVDEFDGDPDENLENDDAEIEPDMATANVGETSVEINVEALIAELEADSGTKSSNDEEDPRKRLEKILEERRAARELEEIDEFAIDSFD